MKTEEKDLLDKWVDNLESLEGILNELHESRKESAFKEEIEELDFEIFVVKEEIKLINQFVEDLKKL